MKRTLLPPVTVYLSMSFFRQMTFLTASTLSIVYQITQADLNPFQLLIVRNCAGSDFARLDCDCGIFPTLSAMTLLSHLEVSGVDSP